MLNSDPTPQGCKAEGVQRYQNNGKNERNGSGKDDVIFQLD